MSLLSQFEPKTFAEFENSDTVVAMLQTFIKLDDLNFLFVGDMGTGKSLFIKTIIREYYGETPILSENILYINSLKEQGINFYRNDVKTFCNSASSNHLKKIVVLDDIDIINDQSQQVFRKYMDECSHKVHFIASCSNPQKVVEAIQSRLKIINLTPLPQLAVGRIVDRIVSAKSIALEPDARTMLLDICGPSVKTAIMYLEKFLLIGEPVTLNLITTVCTNISFADLNEYSNYVLSGDLKSAILLMRKLCRDGYSVIDILDTYFNYIKTSTPIFTEEQKYAIIELIVKYTEIFKNIHEHDIELVLFTGNLVEKLST